MADADQLPLFAIDEAKLTAFLTRWIAAEEDEERCREAKRLIREDYAAYLPLRGVLTAVKITRAKRKLEAHPKEPLSREHQAALEAKVEAYLDVLAAAEELVQVSEGRFTVSMTTGETDDARAHRD